MWRQLSSHLDAALGEGGVIPPPFYKKITIIIITIIQIALWPNASYCMNALDVGKGERGEIRHIRW